jgi:hypothetical protein
VYCDYLLTIGISSSSLSNRWHMNINNLLSLAHSPFPAQNAQV